MNNLIKKVVFVLLIIAIVLVIGVIAKVGKFDKLEGYMYSLAVNIADIATTCDATSSNATSCNATSSNATSCNATSSNATSCNATSSNATSGDTNINGDIHENMPEDEIQGEETTVPSVPVVSTPIVTEPNKGMLNESIPTVNNQDINVQNTNTAINNNQPPVNNQKGEIITTQNPETSRTDVDSEDAKEKVTFLESNKIYTMIIAISVLTVVIVGVILIVDQLTKGKANKE